MQLTGTAGAALIAVHWPAMAAAAQHAHAAKKGAIAHTFRALSPDQAKDVEAIAARIIPTDELPGATEAGVVYFIDIALQGFAKESLPSYGPGLREINELTAKNYPGVSRFSAAKPEQQDKILELLFEETAHRPVMRHEVPHGEKFIETLRMHVIAGFLIDPERGGNLNYAGWKTMGREPDHAFTSPYGFYDKDYPGWQAANQEMEKK